eukprot:12178005-Karenia_brevis.AAC.1
MYKIAGVNESGPPPSHTSNPTPKTQLRANRPKRMGALRLRPQDSSPGPQGQMSLRDMLLAAGYQVEPQDMDEWMPPPPPEPPPADHMEPHPPPSS